MLDQSVLTSPAVVSWNATVPWLTWAAGGLPSSSVVHASSNVLPACSLTVTFSFVGVGL